MDYSWIDELLKQYSNLVNLPGGNLGKDSYEALKTAYGNQDWKAVQGILSGNGFNVTPEQEKWLDNMVSSQNTDEARDWEQFMRDTETISQGNQLKTLGLSSSGVLDIGGASHSGVAPADNVKTNLAQNRYNQRLALAKQLLSMTSSMASAGIYGHALGAAKKASGIVTSAASHSAYQVLDRTSHIPSKVDSMSWEEMIADLSRDEPSDELEYPF